ncbi:MAG: HEAT repeat domain-containing protein [Candidatus Margulisiibacteriota bacterium]
MAISKVRLNNFPRTITSMARIGLFAMAGMALAPTGCSPFQSKKAVPVAEMERAAPPKKRPILEKPPIAISKDGKEIIIGNKADKITFKSPKRIDAQKDKLLQVHELITDLRKRSSSVHSPNYVKDVLIDENATGSALLEISSIRISLNFDYLAVAAHEMGHLIFRFDNSRPVTRRGKAINGWEIGERIAHDKLWMKIYCLSLKNKNYEMLKDSNFAHSPNVDAGHPWDEPSELFASSVMAYRLYPDKFIKKITDPSLSKGARRLGKYIFIYLRDCIFNGEAYFNDPYPNETIKDLKIGKEEIETSLMLALRYGKPNVRLCAAKIIGKIRENYPDPDIKRFPCQDYYPPKQDFTNKKLILSLVKTLSDKAPWVRWAAVKALGKIGDNNVLLDLERTLALDPDPVVQDTARDAIREIRRRELSGE